MHVNNMSIPQPNKHRINLELSSLESRKLIYFAICTPMHHIVSKLYVKFYKNLTNGLGEDALMIFVNPDFVSRGIQNYLKFYPS